MAGAPGGDGFGGWRFGSIATCGGIVAALFVSAAGFWLYLAYRVPPGVEPKGDGGETVAWISLAVAIVSLLTAVVGLVQKMVELRAGREPAP